MMKGDRIMARRTISIDEKIERAKETVSRAKTKYDAALDELEKLMVKKEEMKKQELMAAIESSNKSFDEIMAFLKENM
jgi:formiminotetrahydrofolate cyclodeaminase